MRTRLFGSTISGDRVNVPNVAVIITDGNSDLPDLTLFNATSAKQENITLYVIGITNLMRVSELRNMTSEPVDFHFFSSLNETVLYQLIPELVKRFCTDS